MNKHNSPWVAITDDFGLDIIKDASGNLVSPSTHMDVLLAAPDMYEALKAAAIEIAEFRNVLSRNEPTNAERLAAAALSKAEGAP